MKKFVYIFLWVVLGLMLSFVAHALIEIFYIKNYLPNGFTGHCALPLWLQIGLPVLGILFGFLAGKFFWRVIYVEKRVRRWLKK